MGRPRQHATNAARQKAYRARQRARERAKLIAQLAGNPAWESEFAQECAHLSMHKLKKRVEKVLAKRRKFNVWLRSSDFLGGNARRGPSGPKPKKPLHWDK